MNLYALAWTITAGIGLILSLALLGEALLDRRALGPIQNGRRVLVLARLVGEAIRGLVHAGFLVIGIPALDSPTGPFSWTILILLGGNVGLIVNSLISLAIRRAVELPIPEPLGARELLAEAEASATELRATAEAAAKRVLALAARTATQLERDELHRTLTREAMDEIVVNTAAIADNTAQSDKPDGERDA